MQRTVQKCPYCDRELFIYWDMWGDYYLCRECGFTAEDDDDLHFGAVSQSQALALMTVVRVANGFSPNVILS